MGQHVSRHAGVDDLRYMRAAIAKPEQRRGIGHHLPNGFVIVAGVACHREEQEISGILSQIVVSDFGR